MKKYCCVLIVLFTVVTCAKQMDYTSFRYTVETEIEKKDSEYSGSLIKKLDGIGITVKFLDSLGKHLQDYRGTIHIRSLLEVTIDTLWSDEEEVSYELLKLVFVTVMKDGHAGNDVCIILVARDEQGKDLFRKAYLLTHCQYVHSGVELVESDPSVYQLKITDAPECIGMKIWSEFYDTLYAGVNSLLFSPSVAEPEVFRKSLLDDNEDEEFLRPFVDDE